MKQLEDHKFVEKRELGENESLSHIVNDNSNNKNVLNNKKKHQNGQPSFHILPPKKTNPHNKNNNK